MTRAEFAKGSATFLMVILAGIVSENFLDRHFSATGTDNAAPSDSDEASSPACVDRDGAWKNWSWSNVPILSPKCGEDR
jgi:hypothetical protein